MLVARWPQDQRVLYPIFAILISNMLVLTWSSGQEFQATDLEARVRFPALPQVIGPKRRPLCLVSDNWGVTGKKNSGSGLENPDYGRRWFATLTTREPSIRKSWQAAVANWGHGVVLGLIWAIKYSLCYSTTHQRKQPEDRNETQTNALQCYVFPHFRREICRVNVSLPLQSNTNAAKAGFLACGTECGCQEMLPFEYSPSVD
jgi:hypothetical protein